MTRVEAKAHTHALVLAAARVSFQTKGFEGTHLRDVAKDIGRSIGSIFNCFPGGKDDLWRAAMGREVPDPVGILAQLADEPRPSYIDPRRILSEYAKASRDLLADLRGPCTSA